MELNIVEMLKIRKRETHDDDGITNKCKKWKKRVYWIRFVGLIILFGMPFFYLPRWCNDHHLADL